ncbi:MAG: Uma2 family endonuclease, partial [Spirosomaceae bacterium]|nr:Uma2 family endonuclease [Spirosomataceae bacterium]
MLEIGRKKHPKIKKIPSYLIYEEMNGIALPYKGFRDVLSGKKKVEEIRGSCSLQSILVYIIGLYIGNLINRKKYLIGSNEAGL